jgi:SAM-dependent methyltransferase
MAARPRVPIKLRLKAWWDGCDVIVHQRKAKPAAIETPTRAVIGYRDPERPWETPRVKLAQMLWGEGFSHPGGAEHALRLVKPFGLDPAMTVLDLSSGLGGGPRTLVEHCGVWVTGLEPDREFAEAGRQLSILAGVAKKADICVVIPEKLDLRAGSIDCIICRELFHTVADKPRMLRIIEQALKPRGQFLFTDYMLADREKAGSEPIKAWLEAEPAPVDLWSLDDFTRFLADEKLEVRVTEDVTDDFRRMVIAAWAELTASTTGAALTSELKACLVSELERWTRRIAAFDSGDLRVFRVYALKNASSRMLSDW